MTNNSEIFANQHIMAKELASICDERKKNTLLKMSQNKTILPSPHTIFERDNYSSSLDESRNSTCSRSSSSRDVTLNYSSDEDCFSKLQIHNEKNTSSSSRFFNSKKLINNSEAVEVPDFIMNIVRKTLFEKNKNIYQDKELLKEYSSGNNWAVYLVSGK
jgi:hypothetical protein